MQEIFEKYCKIIQSNELFEGIDEKNLPAVLENLNAVIKHYVKGEYIRMRGEAANFIGIVLEGELHILQDDYYGCRSITASVGAGSFCRSVCMRRSATAHGGYRRQHRLLDIIS